MGVELFVPKFEREERTKRFWALDSISELAPKGDRLNGHFGYRTITFADTIKSGSEKGDGVCRELDKALMVGGDGRIYVSYSESDRRARLKIELANGGRGTALDLNFSNRFSVVGTEFRNAGGSGSLDGLWPSFTTGVLELVRDDLQSGRKAWAEILKKRRQEYFQRNEVGEEDLLQREIETLVGWAGYRRLKEVVLFAGESEEQDGKKVIPLHITSDLRTAVNVRVNYEEVRGATTTATDNEELDVDFGQFKFRIKKIPGDEGEILNAVEETFSEFMEGNGCFGFRREAFGSFTLVGLDPSYEKLTFSVFGELENKA